MPSVILALGTQPALAKGEVMVGGQVGTRSLDFQISQKVRKQLLKDQRLQKIASLEDPHLQLNNKKNNKTMS